MKLNILTGQFAICKLESMKNINFENEPNFLSKTSEEISFVCREEAVPADAITADMGWNGFRIAGTFDFSQVGIIAKISDALAACNIAIFAISTFDTDYIFVKAERFPRAIEILIEDGHTIAV